MGFLAYYLPGTILSFIIFHFTTRDELPVKSKLPKLKFHKFEFSPNLRIVTDKKIIHFHHWMACLLLLGISIPLTNGFWDAHFTKGMFMGGIVQGLLLPNSSKIIYNRDEAWVTFKQSYLQHQVFQTPLRLLKSPFKG